MHTGSAKQVIQYFANGTSAVLPSLLIPRRHHSCGSYIQNGKEANTFFLLSYYLFIHIYSPIYDVQVLIVVAGNTYDDNSNNYVETDTVEIFPDLSSSSSWVSVSTANFPGQIMASRGVTLNNVFYVTGKRRETLTK